MNAVNIKPYSQHPNVLAPHYSEFHITERVLLTGHSHQAWPDCAKVGQLAAWQDAAEYVDKKWDKATAKAEQVKSHFSRLLDDDSGAIALGASTHDLLVRFISALPFRKRPKIVTTDSEFFSIQRQLNRLREEGVEIVRIAAQPYNDLPARLVAALDSKTSALMVSSVFYNSGYRLTDLSELPVACQRVGAELLLDVYHHLNVAPFSIKNLKLDDAYVIGGGYKYLQLGEGNCFLRLPEHCQLTPVVTGWFSDFTSLSALHGNNAVSYGSGGDRFAGATYDPTSHYRAVEVLKFFVAQNLQPALLTEINLHQKNILVSSFDQLDMNPEIIDRDRNLTIEQIGGFVSFDTPHAEFIATQLRDRAVHVDFRGEKLRMGPAPYISDQQLFLALEHLADIVKNIEC